MRWTATSGKSRSSKASTNFAEPGLVQAIDVSSAQPRNLWQLIVENEPEHIVVKLYQRIERISAANPTGAFAQDHSRAQIASAVAGGCSVGGYMWLYATADPQQGIADAVALAVECGLSLPVLWIDVETYTDGSIPGADVIAAAFDECDLLGVRGGIYTSAEMWRRIGNPDFGTRPLWVAQYNGIADLDFTRFDGWGFALGHQYRGSPLDLDVFDASVV